MTKARILILVCFLLTLAAGTAAGLLVGRFDKPRRPGSHLARRLNLTPEQRKRMRTIWSSVQERSWKHLRAGREELRHQLDEAIRGLLPPESVAYYEELMEAHRDGITQLRDEVKAIVEQAVEETKTMLDDEQRKAYEEILKKREESGRRFRFGGPPPAQTQKAAPPGGQD